MKKVFALISSAVAALLLFSCQKTDTSGLQKQIDELKSNEIATIQQQISGIKTSLTSLENTDSELKGYIKTLQQQKEELEKADEALGKSIEDLKTELQGEISAAEANALAQLEEYKTTVANQLSAINTALTTLQNKDTDLQQQITTLKNYVENDLKTYIDNGDNSVKNWVSASFVTLEQYNTTAGIVATIQEQITTINQRLSALEETYVTGQAMQAAISSLDESLKGLINQAVSDCNSAISTAKDEITAAYTTAIQNAIASSESSIKTWVNNQLTGYYTIAQTDAKILALKTNLEGQLTSQKTYLEGLINSLETSLLQKINNNKGLIDGLQGQLNGLNSDLSELAGKVATNTTNISKNAATIATNAKNIATNASDIDACEQLIAANKQLIAANESAISASTSAITTLQNRATADEKLIADNATAIAKNAQDIAANAALISANATAISNNAKAISDNAASIVQLHTDLTTACTEITTAYQQAISTAISTLDGKLSGRITSEVATINTRIDNEVATINATIDALTSRVAQCEKDIKTIKNTIYTMQQDIEELQDQVAAILARIQSIAFVPSYSDGKVPVTYTDNGTLTPGTAVLDFELQPASTAVELAQVWQNALKMKAVYTITKAAPETVQLAITSVSADKGYLSVTISGSALSEDFFRSRCSANAALVISDGNNELASEYVPLVPWTTDIISFGCPNFKAYCVENFDTHGDGEISEDEAKAVTNITASMLNIASLIGIEYFSNLETIDVSFNKLETLDLSHSPKLESVLVNGNKLQSLNLSGLAALKELDCSNNKLTALNVSESEGLLTLNCTNNLIGALNVKKNKLLTDLQCSNNQITALDVKNNTALETLYCRKNNISVLDVTKLALLKNLDCSINQLTALNVYGNPLLGTLYCSNNNLTSLGITANTALEVLDCSNNSLTALDVTKNVALQTIRCTNNNLTSLDVSQNSALETVHCQGNMAMAKLWVKDAAQASALTIQKEDLTQIAYNDGGIVIPDANLKNYLLALFDDDEDGEISILEAENVENVNCSGRSIASLVGLESCPNLKYLNFNGNSVATVDLPNLPKLETIVAYGNPIERLNVDNDIALSELYLQDVDTNALSGTTFSINAYNQAATLYLAFAGTKYTTLNLKNSTVLTSYDIAENVQLTKLVASGNPLVTGVNFASLTALTYLDVNDCGLTALNVDTNIDLVTFDCSSNALTSLNVDNNVALVTFDCSDNQLSTLRVTNNTALDKIDCSDNNLSNINVRKNTVLKTLKVSGNAGITALALGYNTVLETLEAANTGLTDIDLSANLAIKKLNLSGCADMHIIDLAVNTALVDLNVSSTSLATLDVSNNTSLATLEYDGCTINASGLKIGTYVNVASKKGVVFFSSGGTVKIVSADEASKTWDYYGTSTGATSGTDGVANTNKIAANSNAAKWCRAKGSSWYLPAREELLAIYNNKSKLNTTLSSVGGTQLGTGYYWSSTEYDSNYAYRVSFFDSGSSSYTNKKNSYDVRAVRAL